MKKIFLALLLALSFNVAAAPEQCLTDSEMAYTIMSARQNGVPMAKVLMIVESDPVYRQYVMMAYDTPLYSSEEFKERTKREFENSAYRLCLTYHQKKAKK